MNFEESQQIEGLKKILFNRLSDYVNRLTPFPISEDQVVYRVVDDGIDLGLRAYVAADARNPDGSDLTEDEIEDIKTDGVELDTDPTNLRPRVFTTYDDLSLLDYRTVRCFDFGDESEQRLMLEMVQARWPKLLSRHE